jgi:hypothetical protein
MVRASVRKPFGRKAAVNLTGHTRRHSVTPF